MASSSESGLKSRLAELIRIGKDVKEPVVTGSEYEQTKHLLQSYAEQKRYSIDKLERSRKDLEKHRSASRHTEIVGPGYEVCGYGLLWPLSDDYDIVRELRDAAESWRAEHSLAAYHREDRHGHLVLYGYEVKELSLIFPEFLNYDIVRELDGMADALTAAYGVQLYTGAIRSINDMMYYEDNAAQIKGNAELADRIRESDTTLLLTLAAGNSPDAAEPSDREQAIRQASDDEIERTLQEMAQRDTEIRTPSLVAPGYEPTEPIAPALGVATLPSSRRRIRAGERKALRGRERAKA